MLAAQQRPRIDQRVDSARVIRLGRTTHPLTRTGRDLGRAAADVPMERIQMQLSSSPEQQAALEELLAGQHDAASPHFQEWLTPEQFGERFGPAQQDIDAVVAWLQDNGFRVDEIGRGRRTLEFSGTASQVEQAFHTEMHQYDVAGERHLANSMDLAVPEVLVPVIAGVAGLHDFRRQPMHRVLGQAAYAPATNLNGGTRGLSPYDFAAIYNVTPLWNIRFDGTGQSVAIAGRTNIKLSDVATFRSTFGLPSSNPQVILNGRDPGIVSSGEEMEADLDVEWSGAVARGAAIKFVVSASTNASDGVDLSNQYIVNNNLAPVMSVSFGACEAADGRGQPVLQLAVAAGRRTGHLRLRLDGGLRFRGLRQPRRAHSRQPRSRGQRPGFDAVQRRRRRHPVRRYRQPRHVVERGQRCELRFRQGLHPGNRLEREFLHFGQRQRQQSLCGQRRRELALRHAGVAGPARACRRTIPLPPASTIAICRTFRWRPPGTKATWCFTKEASIWWAERRPPRPRSPG